MLKGSSLSVNYIVKINEFHPIQKFLYWWNSRYIKSLLRTILDTKETYVKEV